MEYATCSLDFSGAGFGYGQALLRKTIYWPQKVFLQA